MSNFISKILKARELKNNLEQIYKHYNSNAITEIEKFLVEPRKDINTVFKTKDLSTIASMQDKYTNLYNKHFQASASRFSTGGNLIDAEIGHSKMQILKTIKEFIEKKYKKLSSKSAKSSNKKLNTSFEKQNTSDQIIDAFNMTSANENKFTFYSPEQAKGIINSKTKKFVRFALETKQINGKNLRFS